MQLKFSERVLNHQLQSLLHQPLPVERRERVVAHRCILKGPANYILQIDDTDKFARVTQDDKESSIRLR